MSSRPSPFVGPFQALRVKDLAQKAVSREGKRLLAMKLSAARLRRPVEPLFGRFGHARSSQGLGRVAALRPGPLSALLALLFGAALLAGGHHPALGCAVLFAALCALASRGLAGHALLPIRPSAHHWGLGERGRALGVALFCAGVFSVLFGVLSLDGSAERAGAPRASAPVVVAARRAASPSAAPPARPADAARAPSAATPR
jgi:hypothetical protein